ncbi:hypothetical protein T492DRAFT_871382 [Pavlovales sp. CCMP2436]|nr:hypothetical protein T492DRAFT_871382 [Pavlovales sp. CCMP2436]
MFAKTIRTEALKTDAIVAFQLSLSKFEYDGGLNPTFQEGPFALTLLDISTTCGLRDTLAEDVSFEDKQGSLCGGSGVCLRLLQQALRRPTR